MRSERDIERSFQRADLNVEIHAEGDQHVLDELVEVHRRSTDSRGASTTASHRWVLGLAAIVAVVAGIALLAGRRGRPQPEPPRAERQAVSRIELATAVSLEKAFRQGGIEAVEKQYRKAFGASRTREEAPSAEELLTHLETQDL